MILLVHMLFGAAVGTLFKNPLTATGAAFISHYCLDLLPHRDYPIKNITEKNWGKALPDFMKVIADFALGIIIIFLVSKGRFIIYASGLAALIPDGLTLANCLIPNAILGWHHRIHMKIQFLTNPPEGKPLHHRGQKISTFWRIAAQVLIVAVSVIVLRL